MARIRSVPEDFRVDEVPLYPAKGEGDHTFVQVEKRLRTTEEVARALAHFAGARPRDVGYAGRKDRVAVTTQWLSIPSLDPERAIEFEREGMRALAAVRHPHKLRTGHLRANRFRIVVRDLDEELASGLAERLARLQSGGMPNRFGPQRFGRDGTNPERAAALLAGEAAPSRTSRRDARFLLSALQAAIFNDVLAARPVRLDALERGDVAVVHASGGLFLVEDLEREAPRAAAFEISATGPIFGTRVREPEGEVLARERQAARARGVDPENLRPPPGIRLRGARRPLRIRPEEVSVEFAGESVGKRDVVLDFTLPPGAYASVLLEEILGHDTAGPGGVCFRVQEE